MFVEGKWGAENAHRPAGDGRKGWPEPAEMGRISIGCKGGAPTIAGLSYPLFTGGMRPGRPYLPMRSASRAVGAPAAQAADQTGLRTGHMSRTLSRLGSLFLQEQGGGWASSPLTCLPTLKTGTLSSHSSSDDCFSIIRSHGDATCPREVTFPGQGFLPLFSTVPSVSPL